MFILCAICVSDQILQSETYSWRKRVAPNNDTLIFVPSRVPNYLSMNILKFSTKLYLDVNEFNRIVRNS